MYNKNKKKKSILVLAILLFWAAYITIVAGQHYYNISNLTDQLVSERKKTVDYVADFSSGLLINDNIEHLKSRLDQARTLNLIDFYILQKKDQVVMFYNAQNNVDDLNVDYKNFNVILETPEIAFKTIKIFDYRLTIGVITNKTHLAWIAADQQKYLILHDFFMVTLFLGAILYLLLKDIINLSKIVGSRDRSEIQNISSLSKEGQALLSATSTYETSQKNLKDETEFLSGTLTPAILHEIRGGKEAPYSFESTMVRIDLNGYTQLYLEKKETYVTGILNKYFTAARELIERYNGLVYQYVGDEMVFHFKGPRERSEPMAVACVRSLFELAEEIEASLPEEAGHYFKLKASMASGTILFVKLDTGFGLSGIPLIESARLLSQIDDKSKNSMAVYESSGKYISHICALSEPKAGHLKGFQEAAQVCLVLSFKDREAAFAENVSGFSAYFRSDRDLVSLVARLESILLEHNDDQFFRVVLSLKQLKTTLISPDLESTFIHCLEASYQGHLQKPMNAKVISALVSLATAFIPPRKASSHLVRALSLYLKFPDPRVQANTVMSLSEVTEESADFRAFIHSSHNRLSADALFVEGKKGIDKEMVSKIKSLLNSSEPTHQASGRYVILKLLKHYQDNDMVYYNTNPQLKELEEALAKKAA